MIPRPDFEHACESCGAAVARGETECRRCSACTALADLSGITGRLMADIERVAPIPAIRGRRSVAQGVCA